MNFPILDLTLDLSKKYQRLIHWSKDIYLGEIRAALTANSWIIQENHFTFMYLSYINIIEKKKELSKNAPTKDIKGNVMKIYTEVVKLGMLFASPGYIYLRYLPPSLLPESAPNSWENAKFIISRVRRILEEAISRKNGLVAQYIVERMLKLVVKKNQRLWIQMQIDVDTGAKWIKETTRKLLYNR